MPLPSAAHQPTHAIDRATLIGMSAVLMWSTTVGIYRQITEIFGPYAGAALLFSASAVVALLHAGPAAFKGHRPGYLVVGALLFASYEAALSFAIGLAHTRSQSLEVGLINYLWPSFTIALAVLCREVRASILLVPGVLISLGGVIWASSGDGFSLKMMIGNMRGNPVPYALALIAALLWPCYTMVTRRGSGGKNGVPLFLTVTAIGLWLIYAASDAPPLHFDTKGAIYLVIFGVTTTAAYSAWNHGITYGNLTMMASASYFSPILSVLLSAVLLDMSIGIHFWFGALAVSLGSLICWWASRG